jgi:hypothetical protein
MPNQKQSLTKLAKAAQRPPDKPKTYDEQLEDCLRHLLHIEDPVAFCQDRLKFEPDPWQKRLLRSKSRKIIVNVARQQGKSTTAAAKALHRAVLFPKSVILIVAPAVTQASELRRKIDEHLRNLTGIEAKVDANNKRELEFSNGSRIIILAADEDTVRSYTADMIIEDEGAMVPDTVYEAMEPMLLVTDGQHILLGTPKGLRKHHFPDIWHDASSTWDRYEVSAWSNTRIANNQAKLEALKAEKERLGRLWWFQQEYECSFIAAAQGLVYPYDRKKNFSLMLPRDDRSWQYVMGIDYGFSDSTAFVVLGWQQDDPNVYVVESMEKRGLLATEAAVIAHQLSKKYPFARMVGDMGGFGKGYVEEARRRFHLPIVPAEKQNKRGFIELMVSDLKAGLLKVFPGNEALLDEWSKLPWDEGRDNPMDGHKDHLADACLYAWRACCHFLEEVRKNPPRKGSKEAYDAEAVGLFNERIVETRRPDKHRQLLDARIKGWLTQEQFWTELAEQAEAIALEGRHQRNVYALVDDDEHGGVPWLEQMTETAFLN